MRRSRLIPAVATALVLGACSRSAPEQPLADDLQRDLAMTAGTAVELAPKAGVQQVVSAIESAPAVPRPRPIQKAPRRTPRPAPPRPAAAPVVAKVEVPTPEVTVPAPEPARTTEAAVGGDRPVPVPTERRAPPGGWKSPSEVIRNAPFPINPATSYGH